MRMWNLFWIFILVSCSSQIFASETPNIESIKKFSLQLLTPEQANPEGSDVSFLSPHLNKQDRLIQEFLKEVREFDQHVLAYFHLTLRFFMFEASEKLDLTPKTTFEEDGDPIQTLEDYVTKKLEEYYQTSNKINRYGNWILLSGLVVLATNKATEAVMETNIPGTKFIDNYKSTLDAWYPKVYNSSWAVGGMGLLLKTYAYTRYALSCVHCCKRCFCPREYEANTLDAHRQRSYNMAHKLELLRGRLGNIDLSRNGPLSVKIANQIFFWKQLKETKTRNQFIKNILPLMGFDKKKKE